MMMCKKGADIDFSYSDENLSIDAGDLLTLNIRGKATPVLIIRRHDRDNSDQYIYECLIRKTLVNRSHFWLLANIQK